MYRLPSGEGLIATLDFFTPIVDDPYDWGRIAATNALSDVYAMGGRPLLALNIVNWPVDDLPLEMLARVLQGGVDVAAAEGVVVAGGHSITDPEPKYGMVALGLVAPDEVVRNSTAPVGRRAVPHEAARPRDRLDRDQARAGGRRPRRGGGRTDDDDEPGGRRGDAERGRRGGDRRHRVRAARPPAPDAPGIRCGGRARRRRDPADGPADPRPRSARRGPGRDEAEPRLRPCAHGLRRSPRARADASSPTPRPRAAC